MMRNNLSKWLGRYKPEIVEWLEPCIKLLNGDDDKVITCLGLASRKENGEIGEDEFVAALCHISGVSSIDDIEKCISGQEKVEYIRQETQSRSGNVV